MEKNGAASRSYLPGETIFREGDAGNCMYAVESGTVEISSGYGTTAYKRLTMLQEGSFFGEMGMVRGLPRSATAVAGVQGAVLATITWGTLGSYFKEEPSKVVLIMQQLSRRVAELTEDYIGACREIARLLEERSALEDQLYHLRQASDAGQAAGGSADQIPYQSASQIANQSAGEPVGGNGGKQEAKNAGTESDRVRKAEDLQLKKYMDAYRRYQSMSRPFSIDEEGRFGFFA